MQDRASSLEGDAYTEGPGQQLERGWLLSGSFDEDIYGIRMGITLHNDRFRCDAHRMRRQPFPYVFGQPTPFFSDSLFV